MFGCRRSCRSDCQYRIDRHSPADTHRPASRDSLGSTERGGCAYGDAAENWPRKLLVVLRQSCNCTNILSAFIRRRIRAIQLAHTTLELIHRFVLMRLHPDGELLFQCGDMSDPV